MALCLAAALHGQSRRLVQRQHVPVLVNHEALHETDIILCDRSGCLAGNRPLHLQRRHAHTLTFLQPQVRLCPPPIDTYLARPQKLLELAVFQIRVTRPEPAIEPHARFIRTHINGLDSAH